MMCENLHWASLVVVIICCNKGLGISFSPKSVHHEQIWLILQTLQMSELMAKIFYLLPFFFFFSFGGCGVGCGGYCFLSLILHSVFHYLCHRKIQDSDISKLAMKQSNRRPSSTTYFQTEPKLMTTCNHRLAQHSSRLAQW